MEVPFDPNRSLIAPPNSPTNTPTLVLPAMYTVKEDKLRVLKPVAPNLRAFLKQELDVSRLNRIHTHLWFAGLPQTPRPLHMQLSIGRSLRITERADMHMLWLNSVVYFKPLPDFLLCHQIWEDHLCKNRDLYEAALGFFLSYLGLICHPSDYRIAQETGLVSERISWEQWTAFVQGTFARGILTKKVNPRYRFGELRLKRINWVYLWCRSAHEDGFDTTRGYSYDYQNYSSFVERNLAWLLTAFLYLAVILEAMQVGLATKHLSAKPAFQRASWGITVVSLVAPLFFAGAIVLFTAYLILKNLVFTRQKKGKPRLNDDLWQNAAVAQYKH